VTNTDTSARLLALRNTISGREFFDRMLSGELPAPPMITLLGFRLVDVGEGRVVFAGTVHESLYNGLGVAHGGYAATMLDSAMSCAIATVLPAARVFTTVELKVNFTRPLLAETGEVRCEGSVLHAGSRMATSEGRIVDANGKLYAHGTTTCILIEGSKGSKGSRGSRGSIG
jgi:uncharacterized protein (TIGR00369 family)